jgi:putative oxidoreductase
MNASSTASSVSTRTPPATAYGDAATTAGRVLLALLFFMSGLAKLGASAGTIGYIASKGLPLPGLLYALAVAAEIGGGALLLIGFKARAAALALVVFSVAAAVIFHSQFSDQNQMIHFMKNLAIAGGLLVVATSGAGRFSLDARK